MVWPDSRLFVYNMYVLDFYDNIFGFYLTICYMILFFFQEQELKLKPVVAFDTGMVILEAIFASYSLNLKL